MGKDGSVWLAWRVEKTRAVVQSAINRVGNLTLITQTRVIKRFIFGRLCKKGFLTLHSSPPRLTWVCLFLGVLAYCFRGMKNLLGPSYWPGEQQGIPARRQGRVNNSFPSKMGGKGFFAILDRNVGINDHLMMYGYSDIFSGCNEVLVLQLAGAGTFFYGYSPVVLAPFSTCPQ